jgi:hypothetical protein
MTRATQKVIAMPADPKARREPRRIATRNGCPAYANPPPPRRAPVSMAQWCERHSELAERPSLLARIWRR